MKRLYHILSLMALIGVFAIAGFAGFLFATGRLSAQRIDQIGMVLRGELPKPAAPATQPAAPAVQPSRAEIAHLQAQKEYFELAGERLRTESEQRRALDQRIQLDITRQREELETRRQESKPARKRPSAQPAAQAEAAGIEKELELFASMEPKMGRDLLMKRKDPDAIQVLMRLEPFRVKKIVDACKTDDEKAWIGRILNQIHNMDSEAATGVDGPGAPSR